MSKKICIATIHTENMLPLSNITWDNNKKLYCEKHGYDSRVLLQNKSYEGFDKILFLDSIVQENLHEWILWCDCDTLITNFNKKIEELVVDNKHFFLTTDCNGINGGVFLFKTSSEGLKYFNHIKQKMYELAHLNKYRFGEEQNAMIQTYQQEEFKDIIEILPQKSMNSYDYNLYGYNRIQSLDKLGTQGHWQKGDFILHIPGFGPDRFQERMEHFKKYIKEVIE